MTVAGPYRGLSPFAEADAAYFFGRDADRRIIVDNLIASPLTLLYAPSGVGKTSVLLAGVNPDVRKLKRDDGRPEYTPVVVRNWSGDALAAIGDALSESTGHRTSGSHLVERLDATATDTQTTLLLLLDQFEEFMLYHGNEWAPGEAASELTQVLTARDLPVRVLIGMREDGLAMMDRFKGRVPHLFANYLRLDHLDFEAARKAVTCPLDEWNLTHPDDVWEADPELVDAVLEDVASGQVDLGRTGAGQAGSGASGHVETPFLQLVLTRLWEEEHARGSHRLRAETLRKLGGAAELVRTHLDRRMRSLTRRQRNLAAQAFHQLVTPSGTKVAQSAQDLAQYAGASEDEVTRMLETLSGGDWRILRRVEADDISRYEVFHDVLAEAVLDWRARHEERRRRARLVRIAIGATVLVVAAVVLAGAYQRRAQTARAEQLAASARERLGSEPVAAVKDAAEAVDVRATDSIRGTLRMALMQAGAEGRGSLKGGPGSVKSFHISRDGRLAATGDARGRVQLWTLAGGRPQTFDAPEVETLNFSPDGRLLAVGGGDGVIRVFGDGRNTQRLDVGEPIHVVRWTPRGDRVLAGGETRVTLWDVATSETVAVGGGARAQFSPGGSRVATATKAGLVRVWSLDGSEQALLPGTGRVWALHFTPQGSRVLAAREDGTVNVLNARGCGPGKGVALQAQRATFSGDGFHVALGTADGVYVIDVKTCERTFLGTPQQSPPIALALSPNGSTAVAAGQDGAARVWDVPSGTLVATLLGDWRNRARLSVWGARAGGEIVLTAGDRGGVDSWRLAGLPAARLAPHGVQAVAFGGSGTVLAATASGLRTMELRDPEAVRWVGDPIDADRAALSADGSTVAVHDEDGHLRLGKTGKPAWADLGTAASVTGLALDAGGGRLATTHDGGVTRVWDTARRTQITSVPSEDRRHVAAFSGDDLVVVDREVSLYDLPSRDGRALPSPTPRSVPADEPVVATEGTLLAAAPTGGAVTVRDLGDDEEPTDLLSARSVRALAFAPGGSVLASAGEDGLRLWDTKSGQVLVTLAARPFDAVAFSPDGRWVVAGSRDSGAQVFRCDACGDDDAVRAAAGTFLNAAHPIALAPLAEPPTDVALAGPDTSVEEGGFAPPLVDPNDTEDVSDARPPTLPRGGSRPPVATATPQAEPVPVVPPPVDDAGDGGGGGGGSFDQETG